MPQATMDEAVLRAMARWPSVPEVFGWLTLDRRGRWRLRGDPVTHRGLADFIGRNYAADAAGRWYFQNGPQRVYVALDYAPWVWRLTGAADAAPTLAAHTGAPVTAIRSAWLDEDGNLLLQTEFGLGILDDRDLSRMAEHLAPTGHDGEASTPPLRLHWGGGALAVEAIAADDVPQRFGFQRDPAQTSQSRSGEP